MIQLNEGKTFLWQWDVEQYLEVDSNAPEVHFKVNAQTALSVPMEQGRARIPDILLQKAGSILCYAYDGDATINSFQFGVKPRPKPPGYTFTDTDRKTWEELDKRISSLESCRDALKASSFSINGEGHLIFTIP